MVKVALLSKQQFNLFLLKYLQVVERFYETKKMEVPLTTNQVTNEWLKSALSHLGETIKVKELKSVKNEGGVLSNVFKAKVDIDGNEEKLFIKIMPSDQGQKVFIENHPLDKIEIQTYDKTLPMLQSFEKQEMGTMKLQEMTCRYFGGKYCLDKESRGFYLILEDISDTHQMPNLDKGLTDDQVVDSLRKLAYFHGLSYCFAKKNNVNYLEHHIIPYFAFLEDTEAQVFIADLFKRCIDQLESRKENELASVLKKLSGNYKEKFKWAYDGRCGDFLTHGDIWSNNVMFNGPNCKVVDWQFTSASSPYLDIANMAFMNQDPNKIQANLRKFLVEYLNTFDSICSQTKTQSPWTSFDVFEKLAVERGYVSMFVWLLLSFSPCVYSARIMDRFVYIMKKAMVIKPDFFE